MEKNQANYVPLTPLFFLQRSADIFPKRCALIYNDRRWNWSQLLDRCTRFASGLHRLGVNPGDTVSVLAFNTPEMFEAHFAVPMSGAVLNTINVRLDAATVAYIIDHAEASAFVVDRELYAVLDEALQHTKLQPQIILIDDSTAEQKPPLPTRPYVNYEEVVEQGASDFAWLRPQDEWQALSLNYTSGTTGKPKGVVYHHRGSYLMTMGTVISWQLTPHPRYLYVVPMFHCNGWGHAWTMTAVAGTIVCLRAVSAKRIFTLIAEHDISHFGGAPIVLNMLANAPVGDRRQLKRRVFAMTAGAPPPPKVIENMQNMGFEVMHVYGLTETYGHILQGLPQEGWEDQTIEEQCALKARQGVRFAMTEAVSVLDLESGLAVPADGETMGEIAIRGNTVMKGYLKDKEASAKAFRDGWFLSGDLGVIHSDGYIQLKDRAKDIIISGGENISSVEVENALYQHPAVVEAAVVAMPDSTWGEVPCAFVSLKEDGAVSESELIDFCACKMARFKRPKKIIFGVLPKTATGKIQKHVLRQSLKN